MRCNIDAAIFIVDVTAVTLSWASDVTPEEGFTFVAIHPGSVETDMNNATFGWVIFFSTYFSVSSSSSSSFTRFASHKLAFMPAIHGDSNGSTMASQS
jgi:hypothetical protein